MKNISKMHQSTIAKLKNNGVEDKLTNQVYDLYIQNKNILDNYNFYFSDQFSEFTKEDIKKFEINVGNILFENFVSKLKKRVLKKHIVSFLDNEDILATLRECFDNCENIYKKIKSDLISQDKILSVDQFKDKLLQISNHQNVKINEIKLKVDEHNKKFDDSVELEELCKNVYLIHLTSLSYPLIKDITPAKYCISDGIKKYYENISENIPSFILLNFNYKDDEKDSIHFFSISFMHRLIAFDKNNERINNYEKILSSHIDNLDVYEFFDKSLRKHYSNNKNDAYLEVYFDTINLFSKKIENRDYFKYINKKINNHLDSELRDYTIYQLKDGLKYTLECINSKIKDDFHKQLQNLYTLHTCIKNIELMSCFYKFIVNNDMVNENTIYFIRNLYSQNSEFREVVERRYNRDTYDFTNDIKLWINLPPIKLSNSVKNRINYFLSDYFKYDYKYKNRDLEIYRIYIKNMGLDSSLIDNLLLSLFDKDENNDKINIYYLMNQENKIKAKKILKNHMEKDVEDREIKEYIDKTKEILTDASHLDLLLSRLFKTAFSEKKKLYFYFEMSENCKNKIKKEFFEKDIEDDFDVTLLKLEEYLDEDLDFEFLDE